VSDGFNKPRHASCLPEPSLAISGQRRPQPRLPTERAYGSVHGSSRKVVSIEKPQTNVPFSGRIELSAFQVNKPTVGIARVTARSAESGPPLCLKDAA